MISLFVILCFGGLASSAPQTKLVKPEYDIAKAEQYFEEFIKKFNKEYADEQEKEMRFNLFKKDLENIIELNKESETASFDINKASDLTTEEFRRRYTGYIKMNETIGEMIKVDASILREGVPDACDWRSQNKVTEVKNQRDCGSCWAFSAVGNIESQYAIKHNELKEFSEQQVLDCSSTGNCGGGNIAGGISSAAQKGGIMGEDSYPYEDAQGTCRFQPSQVQAKVTGVRNLQISNDDDLMAALVQYGPVSIAVDSEGKFHDYSGGILDCPAGDLNHAVLLVGYGTENGIPYWIVKNSWGTDHGEGGYWRLKRNQNPCGMMNGAFVVATVA